METLSNIKLSELHMAAEQESQKQPISNPGIQHLLQHLKMTGAHVIGTNQSHASIRSKIWSQTIKHGPLSLWVTINPSNLHDPIAQVFCGEEIDLDEFDQTVGPNAREQMENLAADPYAAARFFHFIIATMLDALIGVQKGVHTLCVMHYASILALWTPWHCKEDLKGGDEEWSEAYNRLEEVDSNVTYAVSNLQHRYECKDAADKDNPTEVDLNGRGFPATSGETELDASSDGEDGQQQEHTVGGGSEADLEQFIVQSQQTEEELHGRHAIEIAKCA
ncbi:uncharacterized protein EI90DRAFT_2907994 [Cantharellus anzutake]|uniref:uncharacterized protein n=1 Tax=Cantharellus anzutake TaxID=1750568 RepID=UPI001905AD81|nr:uncharacterized protein EI90DRAFT_2907994 [Cantharellus anzutake]KAF8338900.1 hypothetical protein EI90DRAFT_2907994 [Cantharellus anzutake]